MRTIKGIVNSARKVLGRVSFIVYRKESGLYGYCSINSPVGQCLLSGGSDVSFKEACTEWQIIPAI